MRMTNIRPPMAEIAEYKRLTEDMCTMDYDSAACVIVRARLQELDDRWKQMARRPVPEGFDPVWTYDVVGVPTQREDVVELSGTTLNFNISDGALPALPLRTRGLLHHTGWDIPTRWAIDANGVCYMDNGHGHALRKVPQTSLEAECENDWDIATIRKALRQRPKLPKWMRTALDSGWTPPTTFDANDYE